MFQFSQFVWPRSYSIWDVFNNFLLLDATDRSKIRSDQKSFFIALSLYPLSFFANTPFKDALWFFLSMRKWFFDQCEHSILSNGISNAVLKKFTKFNIYFNNLLLKLSGIQFPFIILFYFNFLLLLNLSAFSLW